MHLFWLERIMVHQIITPTYSQYFHCNIIQKSDAHYYIFRTNQFKRMETPQNSIRLAQHTARKCNQNDIFFRHFKKGRKKEKSKIIVSMAWIDSLERIDTSRLKRTESFLHYECFRKESLSIPSTSMIITFNRLIVLISIFIIK